jgi:hypothetical protein
LVAHRFSFVSVSALGGAERLSRISFSFIRAKSHPAPVIARASRAHAVLARTIWAAGSVGSGAVKAIKQIMIIATDHADAIIFKVSFTGILRCVLVLSFDIGSSTGVVVLENIIFPPQ